MGLRLHWCGRCCSDYAMILLWYNYIIYIVQGIYQECMLIYTHYMYLIGQQSEKLSEVKGYSLYSIWGTLCHHSGFIEMNEENVFVCLNPKIQPHTICLWS